jgi:Putative zinc-finger
MTEQTRILDHAEARRLAALAVDGLLDAPDLSALDAHLAVCPACRSVATAMDRDAEALRAMDLGPVPVAVRADVAIAAEHRGRGGSVGRWGVIVAVGALLIAGLGSGVIGGAGGRGGATASPGPSDGAAPANAAPNQITWKTDVALLAAQGFSVQAGDKTFSGLAPVKVDSDPGNATYRTLEATWIERGVEMRVSLYFGGDATSWWVSEIRAYDGNAVPKAKWMTATGTWFQSPIGQAWTGDIDVPLKGEGTGISGRLHLAGATIATGAVDNVNEPLGGGQAVGENDRPFAAGGRLHCTGILQMAPRDAEAALLGLGYRLSWRRLTTTGPNTGYAEAMPHAPDGVISEEPVPGGEGELIVFVAPFGDKQARPLPYPSDCPVMDPNQTPAPPKP